jgi:hypothetical protein
MTSPHPLSPVPCDSPKKATSFRAGPPLRAFLSGKTIGLQSPGSRGGEGEPSSACRAVGQTPAYADAGPAAQAVGRRGASFNRWPASPAYAERGRESPNRYRKPTCQFRKSLLVNK